VGILTKKKGVAIAAPFVVLENVPFGCGFLARLLIAGGRFA
jgi:hypothetical protein